MGIGMGMMSGGMRANMYGMMGGGMYNRQMYGGVAAGGGFNGMGGSVANAVYSGTGGQGSKGGAVGSYGYLGGRPW